MATEVQPTLGRSENPRYSLQDMDSYNKGRHIKIDDAYKLISQETDGLSLTKIQNAITEGQIRVYEFNNEKYLDRLDIGRLYHRPAQNKRGLTIERFFTRDLAQENVDPLDSVDYEKRDLRIGYVGPGGKTVFEMEDAEFPKEWDDVSASIVAQKYFFKPDKKEWKEKVRQKIGRDHEYSIANLINRTTNFIADEGWRMGYFATEEDKKAFADELKWLQIQRKFAFNSPVQFNAGIFNEYGVTGTHGLGFWRNPETGGIEKTKSGEYIHPQSHACFIAGPEDDLESILDHVKREGAVFSAGSGIGQDIGALRAEGESLSAGGKSSGPMSFLKIYDDAAGSIKSGGKSRRAARMTTMRYYHPDIMPFVQSKVGEEIKARILMENGYGGGMDGEAVRTVTFQNTNISVRLDDYFFEQVEKKGDVELRWVKSGKVAGKVSAEQMLKEIAFGSWRVGDPAVQYESKIDEMHTAKNSGRQNSTNPCSEYLFLDDTSCNLNSHNVVNYSDKKGNLDHVALRRGFWLTSIAADILNDASSYPMKNTAIISPEFRTIGVGFAGLGSLLMRKGLPYDSDEGRALAGAISALMTGSVYEASADMAEYLGPFTHFEFNKKPMLEVMKKHQMSLENLIKEGKGPSTELLSAASDAWNSAIAKGEKYGYRNAQATVVAPTGTISFLMGCQDSTGLEPGYSLVAEKNLAGGGNVIIVNDEAHNALVNLGYSKEEIKSIEEHIKEKTTVVRAPHMSPDHYDIFATAVGNGNGIGTIPFEGHIKMLGAVQPFISGSMSKTSNLPESATVKDIYDGYLLGHKLGLKALAVFRDKSKTNSALGKNKSFVKLKRGEKEDLIYNANAFRQEVKIDGTPFLVNVGEYDDGRPGEVVINSYTAGSTLGGLLKLAGTDISTALKRGVSLEDFVKKWVGQSLEPHGFVTIDNPEGPHPHIKTATSPQDFIARMLLIEYMGRTDLATEPEKVKLEDLRGFKNGAFRTYDRMDFDEWDLKQVLNDPETGGFVTKPGQITIPKNHNGNGNGIADRGVPCGKCGNIMRQIKPGCFSCGNCGERHGGCGI